jgi:squalene-associated FAD-dependent desaturase
MRARRKLDRHCRRARVDRAGGMTRVAVVGGGLAGIAAALAAIDAGCEVTVLESGRSLGGLTRSFCRADLEVDNGQHVFLRCCTSYLRLLDRLGVRDKVALQHRMDVPVLRPGAPPARLRRSDLPAPLHLASTLLRYRAMPIADRLRIAPAALALRRVDVADPATDGQSFAAWLRRHGQSDRAIEALWDLVGVATLNAHAEEASLAMAATVFQIGLLTRAVAGDIGWSRVPLGQLHGQPACRAIEARGEVVLKARARALRHGADGWHVHTDHADHRDQRADVVVLAVPPTAAAALLPADAVDLPAGWAERLGAAPIVNVHVLLDRRVLDVPFAGAVGSTVQWVFDRTESARVGEGQYLAVSLSAADHLLRLPAADIVDLVVRDLRRLLPAWGTTRVREAFVTREPRATFRPAPGSGAWRPPPRTRVPGLVLAGSWVDTGWPATMEGAVRSGEAAVTAALDLDRPLQRDGAAAA